MYGKSGHRAVRFSRSALLDLPDCRPIGGARRSAVPDCLPCSITTLPRRQEAIPIDPPCTGATTMRCTEDTYGVGCKVAWSDSAPPRSNGGANVRRQGG